MTNGFRVKVMNFAWLEPRPKLGWQGARSQPPPPSSNETYSCWDMGDRCVKYDTQYQHYVKTFDMRYEPVATCFYLRYSVSLRKNNLWHTIIYKDDFMLTEINTSLNSVTKINAPFKNTSTNNTKSDVLTKTLVFLPVDWDKNTLLFTKLLNLMNKFIGFSQTRIFMNSFQFLVRINRIYIYIYIYVYIFVKLGNRILFKLVSQNNRCDLAFSNFRFVFSKTLNKCSSFWL